MSNLARTFRQRVVGFAIAALMAMPVFAGNLQKTTNTGPDKVAIKGYDSVAYFTDGMPMKGKPGIAYSWNDAVWHFASAAHRELFVADPQRYVPQFGGFCSMALVAGKVKDIDPEAWTIIDGKLYLNFTQAFRDKFRDDAARNIKKANDNWAEITQQH